MFLLFKEDLWNQLIESNTFFECFITGDDDDFFLITYEVCVTLPGPTAAQIR